MRFKTSSTLFSALLAMSVTHAFAAELSQPQTSPQVVIDYVPTGTVLPMLDMQFNCGDCEQNAKIKALVEGTYLDQAELEKAKVDDGQKTIYQVSHFRSRGKARFFVGMLAGADNIMGTVSCNGVDKQISDTAISAINGIEAVARNVGKYAYQAVKTCVLGNKKESANEIPSTIENAALHPVTAH